MANEQCRAGLAPPLFIIDPNNTRRYYYNYKWQVLAEYDGSDTLQRTFIYGNYIDEVLLMKVGANDYYYVHDHLYSAAVLANSSGTVLERYEYDAYGEPTIWNADFTTERDSSNYGNPYLFTGRRVDILDSGSLKIQYNRNRSYDYYTGRWLTHDPLGIVPNTRALNYFKPDMQYSQGLSLYQYVSSNPEMGIDPWGLEEESPTYQIDGPVPPWPSNIATAEDPTVWISALDSVLRLPRPWPTTLETAEIFAYSIAGSLYIVGAHDGARFLYYYLRKTGWPGQIADYPRMLRDSESARKYFGEELADAQASAEVIVTGDETTQITRKKCFPHAGIPPSENLNWFAAINKHYTWGRGYVRKGKSRRSCCYYMNLTIHIRDRYDFKRGGRFGWLWLLEAADKAKSYRVVGKHKINVTWIKGYRWSADTDLLELMQGRQKPFPQCE